MQSRSPIESTRQCVAALPPISDLILGVPGIVRYMLVDVCKWDSTAERDALQLQPPLLSTRRKAYAHMKYGLSPSMFGLLTPRLAPTCRSGDKITLAIRSPTLLRETTVPLNGSPLGVSS